MKFLVLTYGTDGDTRPLVALSRALMDAGHEAHLLADGASLGIATALGVPATPLAGDIRAALRHDGAAAGLFEQNSANSIAKKLAQIANENAEHWLRSAVQFGKGCDAIILSGLAGFVGLSAAEYLGVKPIGTGLFPLTPTKATSASKGRTTFPAKADPHPCARRYRNRIRGVALAVVQNEAATSRCTLFRTIGVVPGTESVPNLIQELRHTATREQ